MEKENWKLCHFVVEQIPGDDSRVMSSDYFSWIDAEKVVHCLECYLKNPPDGIILSDLFRVYGLYHKAIRLMEILKP
jgi:hypothetical protein